MFILYHAEEEAVGCEVLCDTCRMLSSCGKICSIGIQLGGPFEFSGSFYCLIHVLLVVSAIGFQVVMLMEHLAMLVSEA